MATGVPPKRNSAYVLYTGLASQANPLTLQTNPTLATGDVQVSVDGGTFANLATLPTVTPSGGKAVKISLSASEMNGDNIVVLFVDVAGAEWCEHLIELQTAAQQLNDLFPTSSYVVPLDAAATRTALGLATANLDTQLGGIQADTNDLQTRPAPLDAAGTRSAVGLATANLDTQLGGIQSDTDELQTRPAPLDAAATRTALGLATANLDTQLQGITGYLDTEVAAILAAVDTEVAAIKAQTDQLAFQAGKTLARLVDPADLDTDVAQKLADIVLRRVAVNIETSSEGDTPLATSSLYGLIQRAEKSTTTAVPGKHRIYQTDGATVVGDVDLVTDAEAEGITGFGGL